MEGSMAEIQSKVEQVQLANQAYRLGSPIMSDQEYDSILESLSDEMPPSDFRSLLDSLNEGQVESDPHGKVRHPFVMGSLDKLKHEEPEAVLKWIRGHVPKSMSISAKVDGISSRAEYRDGRLVSLTTRGDGHLGLDVTSKAKWVKSLPDVLSSPFTGNVRGELVILRRDFESIREKYANPRNACAGIMNRKDGDRKFSESEARLISFVPYTILGPDLEKAEQFDELDRLGFPLVAWHRTMGLDEIDDGTVEDLFQMALEERPYETDGLVLCDGSWRNEDEYRPVGCVAFKTNTSIGTTKVVGIDWGTPSATGKMTPVAVLEPVQLAGTTVRRATCHNISFMEKMGIGIGRTVRVLKAGEIIPKIVEVLD